MEGHEKVERTSEPVVFIVEPVAGVTYGHHTLQPMTEENVARSLMGFEDYQKIGLVDELLPDLGERGFGAFKYHPSSGRMEQERAIVGVRLGDNGSEEDLQRLLHWVQYQGTGSIEEHLCTISIDPSANVLAVNVNDAVTLRVPLILIREMLAKHEELDKIRLGKMMD